MNEQDATRTVSEKRTRFSEFDLAADVLEALEQMGLETPTPIQEKVIGPILAGKDVVGKAETGTGKTVGFGAPLVGKIDTQRVAVQGLVLAPTRELAQQVAGVLEQLGSRRGLGVALIVGGVHASEQVLKLRSGSQVVVGTPGRVLDFLRERILSLVWCETVVLDEADRMLDMGFIEDVSAILEKIPLERQTLLFSATIPAEIRNLLEKYMKDPEIYSTSPGLATVPEIRQEYREVEFRHKFRELQRILAAHDGTAIIFCNTRRQAIDLDRMLWGHGYSAGALHGDQEQDVRFRILSSFRAGEIRILVATDVASRGLDIEDVGVVINYEVPDDPESYVHRIGRTGRANNTGWAITLVSSKERRQWLEILRQTRFPVERSGPARAAGPRGEGAPRRDQGGERRPARRERSGKGGARRDRATASRDGAPPGPGAAEPRGEEQHSRRRSRRRRKPDGGRTASAGARTESPGGAESGGSIPSAPLGTGEKEALARPRPEKVKLSALDDDFVKTDYFEVDPDLVHRARTKAGSEAEAKHGSGQGPAVQGAGRKRRRRRSRSKRSNSGG